mgnify:CR=1 FL=1
MKHLQNDDSGNRLVLSQPDVGQRHEFIFLIGDPFRSDDGKSRGMPGGFR